MASTRSRKALAPIGRPILSERRSASERRASSPEDSSAAKSGMRSSTGGGVGDAIAPRGIEQSVHARPTPRLGPRDQPGAHRIERDIPERRQQMRLIHRHAAEAALPEMSGALFARVDAPGIGPMHFRERRAQCIDMIGHKHQVDMIGHQHPTPHRHAARAAMPAKQFAVGGIVGLPEERPLPSVPLLGDVVRNAGQYIAPVAPSTHDGTAPRQRQFSALSP